MTPEEFGIDFPHEMTQEQLHATMGAILAQANEQRDRKDLTHIYRMAGVLAAELYHRGE